jgi:hypothetical protein
MQMFPPSTLTSNVIIAALKGAPTAFFLIFLIIEIHVI